RSTASNRAGGTKWGAAGASRLPGLARRRAQPSTTGVAASARGRVLRRVPPPPHRRRAAAQPERQPPPAREDGPLGVPRLPRARVLARGARRRCARPQQLRGSSPDRPRHLRHGAGPTQATEEAMNRIAAGVLFLAACAQPPAAGGVSPRQMADALFTVLSADRTVYTTRVVNRLQNVDKVVKATEHFEDDKALPLPAQMFRMGAELSSKKTEAFTY